MHLELTTSIEDRLVRDSNLRVEVWRTISKALTQIVCGRMSFCAPRVGHLDPITSDLAAETRCPMLLD